MISHTGEAISFIVALSWTVTVLGFEYASKKTGFLSLNIPRLAMAMSLPGIAPSAVTGSRLFI